MAARCFQSPPGLLKLTCREGRPASVTFTDARESPDADSLPDRAVARRGGFHSAKKE